MQNFVAYVGFVVTLINTLVNCTDPEAYDIAIEKCLKEMGITFKHVDVSLTQDLKDVDEKVKCFVACFMKDTKMMQEDGSIDTNKKLETMNNEAMTPVAARKEIEACFDLKEGNDCDTAFVIASCITKAERRGPTPKEV